MEIRYISLEIRESNKLIRIFQVTLGIMCVLIAGFWVVFNIRSVKTDSTLWLTVAFLCGFGLFQILSGFGYASKFIELSDNVIRLKKNSLLPQQLISYEQIEKVEIYPLKFHILLKSSKKILVRLGITDPEKIELVKDEIILFASRNSLNLEFMNE